MPTIVAIAAAEFASLCLGLLSDRRSHYWALIHNQIVGADQIDGHRNQPSSQSAFQLR
jgi:hypothetical protein